ncbi:Asp-tRNA(Asn)/Glu-tRNA(Gln) amidotransferase subunit GatC [Candidatus Saccharibacteria bacterium]|nr:Asp-tRNA(Asn)/Glu-tRNA(Gln) amidotransferase subunit GatC [Candidatus Saccharibacteria bacterium]
MSARNPVKVDQTTVKHLAMLSDIHLSDQKLAKLTADLEGIIKHIEQLSELDTTGVEPTFQVTELKNVWREDVVEEQLPREELLTLAPNRTETAVKVPKVL